MKKTILLVAVLLVSTMMCLAQDRVLLLNESFDGASMPTGWSIMGLGTNNWEVKASNKAGGDPNELHLKYSPPFNGISRLVTPAVDLTNISEVVFLFKHCLDNYSDSHTLGIATSSDDGTTWNVGWSKNYSSDGVYSVAEHIMTPDMGKNAVRFCIYYNGNSYNMDNWYFDDIKILQMEELDVNFDKIVVDKVLPYGDVAPSFGVTNYGNQNITTIEATYQFEGNDAVVQTFTADLPSLESMTFAFNDSTYLYPGAYPLTITLSKVNGQSIEKTRSKNIYIAMGETQKYPMIEHFSSSTCGPCVAVNNAMAAFENNNQGKYTYTKYPMNWPGSGDPYFTEEGRVRRYYYSVGSVPQTFLDGEDQGYTSVSQSAFDSHYANPTFADIKGSFNVEGNNITVIADVMSYCELGEDYRVYVSVNEKETHGNVGGNGETSFHHIMMKMLENAEGNTVNVEGGKSQRFEFTYDMSSTHVEEMSDLEVSVWLQDNGSKKVINSRFMNPYTDLHPYPVENLLLEETTDSTMMVSWEVPALGTPTGYNVFLDGDMLAANTVETSMSFDVEAGSFHVVEVEAVYSETITSVKAAASKRNTWKVAENKAEVSCRLFPNPANETVYVVSDSKIRQIAVYSIAGMMVERFEADSEKVELSVANYNSGVYFIQVVSHEGNTITKKLVVK
ncbi:MAG: T9SS type A sorting domain-containing protein [Candidatus Limimorpha sp.]